MRVLGLFMCLLLLSCGGVKQPAKADVSANMKNIEETVYFLASDEIKGRNTSTYENQVAAKYLADKLNEYHIKPFFTSYNDTLSTIKDTWNVVGVIEGTDKELASEYVVLGAHYDHIGIVSKLVEGDSIANGANDNAAGTAILLELSRNLAKLKESKRSVIIAFFTAEEIGLVGSKHLATRLKEANVNVVSMLNFEMLGLSMNRDYMAYLTGYDLSTLAERLNHYAGEALVGKLEKAEEYQLFKRSDNYPFYEAFKIPSQTFSSFDFENYEYYHHVKDEAHLMNYEFMTEFTNKVIPVVSKVINAPQGEIRMK
ncbi:MULTISPECIES: M20/M25/M40 family metallo-hydrolase [Myroides]|uniref:M20/M25/M40 family metallo-hydrolase n=1 Tax=Myroides albus TaxID=2562892 RepID=A0A6I3LHF8_9FLAO|nr:MULTISPECIES: M20/M25/M40 family metallo-hydrolase [Myroides]MTG97267.1 M20/M25/M40 family metallo-hydrolase [Myroides albus]MVX34286.1 M20/M25/M40 family metallo-hydrolase [Myroides sp. LoEW2-1]UVD80645.1 M20/M25/M40 family metallo-hydrolase [Myroides albus]